MKKKLLSLLFVVFLASVSAVPAFAIATRASDRISYFTSKVSAQFDSSLDIYVLVEGRDSMDEIGVEEIKIYRQSDSKWIKVDSYDKNDNGMTKTSSGRYKNTITFDGTPGAEYKIEVTVFAEDSSGYDSRTKTHYVTAK